MYIHATFFHVNLKCFFYLTSIANLEPLIRPSKHDFGLGEEAVIPQEKPTQAQTPNKKIKIRNLLAVRQQC